MDNLPSELGDANGAYPQDWIPDGWRPRRANGYVEEMPCFWVSEADPEERTSEAPSNGTPDSIGAAQDDGQLDTVRQEIVKGRLRWVMPDSTRATIAATIVSDPQAGGLGWDARWNLRTRKVEVWDPTANDEHYELKLPERLDSRPREEEEEWVPLDDGHLEKLAGTLERDYAERGKESPRLLNASGAASVKRVREALRFYSHSVGNSVEPIQQYLARLEECPNTNPLPEDYSLFDLTGYAVPADQKAYADWCMRSVLAGAVGRSYERLVWDLVVVLHGAQGLGKDVLISALPPLERYVVEFEWGLTKKMLIEQLGEGMIAKVSEMAGRGRADLDRMKAFISATTMRDRLSYAHEEGTYRIYPVLIGTTNDRDSLPPDVTGNRRFAPIEMLGTQDRDSYPRVIGVMNEIRGQMWLRALYDYRSGAYHPSAMPEDVALVRRRLARGHMFSGSAVDACRDWIAEQLIKAAARADPDKPNPESDTFDVENPDALLEVEVAQGAGLWTPSDSEMTPRDKDVKFGVAAALKALGYEKSDNRVKAITINGRKVRRRLWIRTRGMQV